MADLREQIARARVVMNGRAYAEVGGDLADAVMAVLRDPANAADVRALGTPQRFVACPWCDVAGLGPNALEKHIERRHPAALTAEEASP